ncbi:MAG: Holliday junction resolvase RuvX [Candidatus Magasanikbacteria bacterium]|nr:Holliday junction resolvase RuvX [Candidatus Magasanikbacteria bacterium]
MYPILGIDYGTARIGCAIADATTHIPLPYAIIQVETKEDTLGSIVRMVSDEKIATVVVGLPLGQEGKETFMSARARTFGEELKQKINANVVFEDERYTSRMGKEASNPKAQRTKGNADQRAAMFIVERFIARMFFKML